MKVVCIDAALPGDGPSVYALTVGREYVVIGLTFRDGCIWLDLPIAPGTVISAPLDRFRVVDDRASGFWRLRAWEEGVIGLRPEEFGTPFFLDDASDQREPAFSIMEALIDRLQAE